MKKKKKEVREKNVHLKSISEHQYSVLSLLSYCNVCQNCYGMLTGPSICLCTAEIHYWRASPLSQPVPWHCQWTILKLTTVLHDRCLAVLTTVITISEKYISHYIICQITQLSHFNPPMLKSSNKELISLVETWKILLKIGPLTENGNSYYEMTENCLTETVYNHMLLDSPMTKKNLH